MKFNQAPVGSVITHGDVSTNKVGIKTGDMDWIIQILSSNLYQHPIKSFIRETVSNAWDSHIEAGNNNPILVELGKSVTTSTSFFCRITDWGVGISKERFNDIYRNIGASTKRDSNEMIGGFGIGRFSALAYSPSVTITSTHNGVKTIYVMYKKDNSIQIDEISSFDYPEGDNGVSIEVPVVERDLRAFNATILEDLIMFDKLVYKDTTEKDFLNALSDNAKEAKFEDIKTKVFKEDNFVLVNKTLSNHILRRQQDSLFILIGKVIYPMPTQIVDRLDDEDKELLHFLKLGIIFGIGELMVTPNRENISLNDSSSEVILLRLQEVIAKLKELRKALLSPILWDSLSTKEKLDQFKFIGDSRNESLQKGVQLWETNFFPGKLYDTVYHTEHIKDSQGNFLEISAFELQKATKDFRSIPDTISARVNSAPSDYFFKGYTKKGYSAKYANTYWVRDFQASFLNIFMKYGSKALINDAVANITGGPVQKWYLVYSGEGQTSLTKAYVESLKKKYNVSLISISPKTFNELVAHFEDKLEWNPERDETSNRAAFDRFQIIKSFIEPLTSDTTLTSRFLFGHKGERLLKVLSEEDVPDTFKTAYLQEKERKRLARLANKKKRITYDEETISFHTYDYYNNSKGQFVSQTMKVSEFRKKFLNKALVVYLVRSSSPAEANQIRSMLRNVAAYSSYANSKIRFISISRKSERYFEEDLNFVSYDQFFTGNYKHTRELMTYEAIMRILESALDKDRKAVENFIGNFRESDSYAFESPLQLLFPFAAKLTNYIKSVESLFEGSYGTMQRFVKTGHFSLENQLRFYEAGLLNPIFDEVVKNATLLSNIEKTYKTFYETNLSLRSSYPLKRCLEKKDEGFFVYCSALYKDIVRRKIFGRPASKAIIYFN